MPIPFIANRATGTHSHATPTKSEPRQDGLSNAELSEIYTRYAHFVRRWAFRFLGDSAAADDILHEVMLRTLHKGRQLLQLDHESARKRWLQTTTIRLCLNLRRSRSREVIRDEPEALQGEVRGVALHENRQILEALLSRLNREERMLAVLHFEYGHNKVELKELMKRSRPFLDKKLRKIYDVLEQLQEERKT